MSYQLTTIIVRHTEPITFYVELAYVVKKYAKKIDHIGSSHQTATGFYECTIILKPKLLPPKPTPPKIDNPAVDFLGAPRNFPKGGSQEPRVSDRIFYPQPQTPVPEATPIVVPGVQKMHRFPEAPVASDSALLNLQVPLHRTQFEFGNAFTDEEYFEMKYGHELDVLSELDEMAEKLAQPRQRVKIDRPGKKLSKFGQRHC